MPPAPDHETAEEKDLDLSPRAPDRGALLVWSNEAPCYVAVPIDGELAIGRAAGFPQGDDFVSSVHARVRDDGDGGWLVEDLGSRHGTYVEGARLDDATPTPVRDGALLRVGRSLLLFTSDLTRHSAIGGSLVMHAPDGDRIEGVASTVAREALARIARRSEVVLLQGETGTGKESHARLFHTLTARRGKLLTFNAAGVTEDNAITVLFGAEKGAYTGAVTRKVGAFEEADGGTVFLDEFADLTPKVQGLLLRLLQEGEIQRFGGETKRVDCAVVVATHKNLRDLVARGELREDLYHRVAAMTVTLPALRERREEIPWLISMALHASEADVARRGVTHAGAPLSASAAFVEACLLRRWTGNVRELMGAVRSAIVAAEGRLEGVRARGGGAGARRVEAEDLGAEVGRGFDVRVGDEKPEAEVASVGKALARAEEDEKRRVIAALVRHKGKVAAAARELGKPRTTVQGLMKKWGLFGG